MKQLSITQCENVNGAGWAFAVGVLASLTAAVIYDNGGKQAVENVKNWLKENTVVGPRGGNPSPSTPGAGTLELQFEGLSAGTFNLGGYNMTESGAWDLALDSLAAEVMATFNRGGSGSVMIQ
jgi:hypothetical protein